MSYFLFIGGDERQKQAANYLEKAGERAGFVLDESELSAHIFADFVVLPLPATRDNVLVNGTGIRLKTVWGFVNENQILCGGLLPKNDECKAKSLYDYYKDEAFIIRNSVSTAEGVICEIIGRKSMNICGSKMAVIGYGKAGRAIALRLRALGAQVYAAARSERDIANAQADGCEAVNLYSVSEIADCLDAVVNTVPSRVLGKGFLERLERDCLLLEVASAPYGIDFEAAEKLGVETVKLPSLPARYAPLSSGVALAEFLLDIKRKGEGSNGES